MTGAVDVGVVPRIRLVLDVGSRNCDTTFSFLRRFVDRAIVKKVGVAFLGLTLCYRSSEGGLND